MLIRSGKLLIIELIEIDRIGSVRSSVLPMANGVTATPTGYIINGAPTGNMTSATAQLGYVSTGGCVEMCSDENLFDVCWCASACG